MSELRGFKFRITLVLVFKKIESKHKTKYDNFYSSTEAEVIINKNDIGDVFESIYSTIVSNIQKSLGNVSVWIIDSVINNTVSISKCNILAEGSYIKLPKKIDHSRKGLINIRNIDDNECFKWSIVRYLNPVDHNPKGITEADEVLLKTSF